MLYKDLIYGEVKIDESVILELINSNSLQRLKNIDRSGYPQPWHPEVKIDQYENSRFTHSLGVYILLNKYGAPPEEQIAGLIHDVSHSAFSHCIDYVLEGGSQKEHSHQDNVFEKFVKKSEIPEILKKYNFDLEYILNDDNLPLKEKKIPDICADRIDYCLRDGVIFGEIGEKQVYRLFDSLITKESNWIFRDFESAKKYAELFLVMNRDYYSGIKSALMFKTVSDYLKYALEKDYVSEDDFYTTDAEVLSKIEKSLDKDENSKLFYNRMNNKIGFTNDPKNYETNIYCKSRIVDPLFLQNEKILKVSDVDKEWERIVQEELKPKEYFLKFDK